jgi:ribonuclease J
MPIHGEQRHLAANRELAMEVGIPSNKIFVSEVGKVLELDRRSARFAGSVQSGNVLVDGYGVGDVGNIVLNDRRHLSQDGLIVVVASVDSFSGFITSPPEIVSRGFVYVRENEELIEEIRQIAADSIEKALKRSRRIDRADLKNTVKDDLSKYLYARTKRKPMVLPVIIDA